MRRALFPAALLTLVASTALAQRGPIPRDAAPARAAERQQAATATPARRPAPSAASSVAAPRPSPARQLPAVAPSRALMPFVLTPSAAAASTTLMARTAPPSPDLPAAGRTGRPATLPPYSWEQPTATGPRPLGAVSLAPYLLERRPVPAPPTALHARAGAVPTSPGEACRLAILSAEIEHRVPEGLLQAIARVESGRQDPFGRGITPWPWTINAEGRGRYFDSKAEAIAEVQALQARGVRVIDVGCMQINLFHHPTAFPNLDMAFDPVANARYGGLFLRRLFNTRQDWEAAAAAYHSATPEFSEPYRARVMAAWQGMPARAPGDAARAAAMVAAWNPGALSTSPRMMRWNGVSMIAMGGVRLGNGYSVLEGLATAPLPYAPRPLGAPPALPVVYTPTQVVTRAATPARRGATTQVADATPATRGRGR